MQNPIHGGLFVYLLFWLGYISFRKLRSESWKANLNPNYDGILQGKR